MSETPATPSAPDASDDQPASDKVVRKLYPPRKRGRAKSTGEPGRPPGSTEFNEEQVKRALSMAGGNQAEARRVLKKLYGRAVSRSTISTYVKSSPALQQALAEIDEVKLDYVESLQWKRIEAGDVRCIHFYLAHKGKARGWGNSKVEVSGPEGGPVPMTMDWSQVPLDVVKALLDARPRD